MNSKKPLLANLKATVIDRETAKTVVGGYYCSWGGSGGTLYCPGSIPESGGCSAVYVGGGIPCLVCSLSTINSGQILCKGFY